jgi:hypothetical protein
MKKVQKIIVIIYLALVVLACISMPWKIDYVVIGTDFSGHSGTERYGTAYKYSFLWAPPSLEHLTQVTPIERVDVIKTTAEPWKIPLELIALTAVFGVLFVLTLGPKKD